MKKETHFSHCRPKPMGFNIWIFFLFFPINIIFIWNDGNQLESSWMTVFIILAGWFASILNIFNAANVYLEIFLIYLKRCSILVVVVVAKCMQSIWTMASKLTNSPHLTQLKEVLDCGFSLRDFFVHYIEFDWFFF